MNAAMLAALGTGIGTAATNVARAVTSKIGSTNKTNSASSQFNLDSAINRITSAVQSNNATSQQMADAANQFTREQSDRAMEFSAAEAAKNRDWQKMMSDTAHQREIRDLQAAGLNPVLSAMGGQGAAVTSGATASSSAGTGQKGETDHALSTGLVSLLGTMLTAQTNLAQTAMSARSNEAIAAKNNAMSKLIAEITGQYALSRETLAGEYGLKRQYMSDVYADWRAGVAAAASRYAADRHYASSVDSAAIHAQNAIELARDYPQSLWGSIGSLTGALGGADSFYSGVRESARGIGEWIKGLFEGKRTGGRANKGSGAGRGSYQAKNGFEN